LAIALSLNLLQQPFRTLYILGLAGLRPATQQKQYDLLPLHEVDPVTGAGVNAHLSDSTADDFAIAQIP
jgi:hypothetical protein